MREPIRERTRAGLKAARARGRLGGRRRKLTNKQIEMAKKLMADKSNSVKDICKTLGISRATLYQSSLTRLEIMLTRTVR